ncbi:hypothetical protein, partial [Rhodococcus sp. BP-331]|uniref:hypothetical protein n=1 Tax=Rhodococcus sp. BP-331 TaxID=2739446 RepID=UPI001C9B18B8
VVVVVVVVHRSHRKIPPDTTRERNMSGGPTGATLAALKDSNATAPQWRHSDHAMSPIAGLTTHFILCGAGKCRLPTASTGPTDSR